MKCHGFGGLIRVKMFASWGKKLQFFKIKPFWEDLSYLLCKNWPNVIKFLIFLLQVIFLDKLSLLKEPKLSQIRHGEKYFENQLTT